MSIKTVMKNSLKAVWRWWLGIIVTDQWIPTCAWILSLTLGVPQAKAEEMIGKVADFIVEAATANPGRKQGDAKWEFAWAKVQEELGEWIDSHGKMTMEIVTLAILKILTVRKVAT